MKKILFLLLICVVDLMAFEYQIARSRSNQYNYYTYYYDSNGVFKIMRNVTSGYTDIVAGANDVIYNQLNYIKSGTNSGTLEYISRLEFDNILKSDPVFLNLFFTQNPVTLNSLLNYFYNDSNFSGDNNIHYDNYELLYNSDGLAVESLVDGVYAGLYNMDEMQFSGNLYNENGDLVLVNGFEPSFFQVLCDKLIGDLHLKMLDAENLIDKGWIFAVALTFAMFYLIARTFKRVLIGKNNKGVENES